MVTVDATGCRRAIANTIIDKHADHVLAPKGNQGIVRSHRTVENSLHQAMDMVFYDHECRPRTRDAPAHSLPWKHIALDLT